VNAKTAAMFDMPQYPPLELSRMYATAGDRAAAGRKISWTQIKNKTLPDCDECFARQHETAGNSGPRRRAKWRRTIQNGRRLALCGEHADLWSQRDTTDGKS